MSFTKLAIEDVKALAKALKKFISVPDSVLVTDLLSANSSKDYSTKFLRKGTLVKIWFQFYFTAALLNYLVTLDGSPVIKNMSGSGNTLALHQATVEILVNVQFDAGAVLNFHLTNSDIFDPHRVRAVAYVEYDVL